MATCKAPLPETLRPVTDDQPELACTRTKGHTPEDGQPLNYHHVSAPGVQTDPPTDAPVEYRWLVTT